MGRRCVEHTVAACVGAGAAARVRDSWSRCGRPSASTPRAGPPPRPRSDAGSARLPELRADARGGNTAGQHRWPALQPGIHLVAPPRGLAPLRRKYFLPDEPGGWEAHWFDRGDAGLPGIPCRRPVVRTQHLHRTVGAGDLCGLRRSGGAGRSCRRGRRRRPRRPSGCRWAWWRPCARRLQSCRPTGWTRRVPAAVWAGSSARTARVLARTTPQVPFATIDIDLAASVAAGAGLSPLRIRRTRCVAAGTQEPGAKDDHPRGKSRLFTAARGGHPDYVGDVANIPTRPATAVTTPRYPIQRGKPE